MRMVNLHSWNLGNTSPEGMAVSRDFLDLHLKRLMGAELVSACPQCAGVCRCGRHSGAGKGD